MTDAWKDYFEAAATIAAALLGLAFVAFQTNPAWQKKLLWRLVAAQTLAEFLVPVTVGLSLVMPGSRWRPVAVVAGVAGLALVAAHICAVLEHGYQNLHGCFDRLYVWLDVIPLAVYLGIIACGLLVLGVPVLAFLTLWLIVSGSVEAFAFMSLRRDEDGETAPAKGTEDVTWA